MLFSVFAQPTSPVLHLSLSAVEANCSQDYEIPVKVSEREVYDIFLEKTASFRCRTNTSVELNSESITEIARIVYLTIFPTVLASDRTNHANQYKVDESDTLRTSKYDFDRLTGTPIYYAWTSLSNECLTKSVIKIRSVEELSGIWLPKSAVVAMVFQCDSDEQRYFIRMQRTQIGNQRLSSIDH